jgi:hypothetical protein
MLAAAGLLVGLGGVVLLILLVTGGGRFSRESSPLRPVDPEFNAGDAEARAAAIERDGVPLLFPDPAGGERPIWLNHLGDDPEEGWVAFDAQVGAGCLVDWEADTEEFVDCNGDRYPPDGEGLPQYDVRVEDGEVIVDLHPDEPTTVSPNPESGASP